MTSPFPVAIQPPEYPRPNLHKEEPCADVVGHRAHPDVPMLLEVLGCDYWKEMGRSHSMPLSLDHSKRLGPKSAETDYATYLHRVLYS